MIRTRVSGALGALGSRGGDESPSRLSSARFGHCPGGLRSRFALWELVEDGESARKRSIRVEKLAILVPEPKNQCDRNAVAVYIDQVQVGYVPRRDASRVAATLAGIHPRLAGACDAAIVGDKPSETEPRPRLVVYLDL